MRLGSYLNRDVLAGVMFVTLGLLGLWLVRDLQIGSVANMQAGFFPTAMSVLLIIVGAAVAGLALRREDALPSGLAWRPLFFVSLSPLPFAFLLEPLGLVLTLGTTVFIANLASRPLGVVAVLLLAAALAAMNAAVFVFALGMPIRLWPELF